MKASALLAVLVLAAPAATPAAAPGGAPAGLHRADISTAPRAEWNWPLAPKPEVLRAFDPPDQPWMSGHRGVDLRAAFDGAAVTAPASGTVSFAGVVVDRPVITIDHGNGLRSSFEPVETSLAVGAPVPKGGMLGTVRAGHCGPVPCVHWGVRRGGDYLNPLSFVIDLRRSILLPVGVPGTG